ncbi:M23 family metallopeptidase [Cellulosimicrobium sp. PMB13]|uniref:murein hydrolase activator EnvC family protein n=1 Tax=Cellulosimicrobium sp. PMB13 TaxID=3120158 RepID=UPI003F4B247D
MRPHRPAARHVAGRRTAASSVAPRGTPRRRGALAPLVVALVLLSAVPVPGAGAAPAPGAAVWVPPLDRTLDALDVLAPFDPPAQDWLPGHRGVDLAASPGEAVRAPSAGVVTFAGPVAGRGVVVISHDDGLRTSLEPVVTDVRPGMRVATGEVVGATEVPGEGGATASQHGGHCAGTCVHWGVRRGERYVDPLALLGDRPPIVLLPLS